MSAPDPSTDSCMEQCCRDYCHRHVSFLLTLPLFAGTHSLDFQRQQQRSNLHLTFFMKANSSTIVRLFLALEKSKALSKKPEIFLSLVNPNTKTVVRDVTSKDNPTLLSYSVVLLIKTTETSPQFFLR